MKNLIDNKKKKKKKLAHQMMPLFMKINSR